MIFNIGSFFNTAKRQAQAEREREHQIYARWAEASRRAESREGEADPGASTGAGEWTVGGGETFEEEMTYSLTEADIVEADDLEEEMVRSPRWLRSVDAEEESGSEAGEYLGEAHSSAIDNQPDERQFEMPFLKQPENQNETIPAVGQSEAMEPAPISNINSAPVSTGPVNSAPVAVDPIQTAPAEVSAGLKMAAPSSSEPTPSASGAFPEMFSMPEQRKSERKTPGFLRGLSAAVERTIASATAIGTARDSAQYIKPTQSKPNPGPTEGWSRLGEQNTRPARLSMDGMIDNRMRPLDMLRSEQRPALIAAAPPVQQQPATRPSDGRIPAGDMQLDVERDLRARFGGDIRSALGCGTVIEGKFTFDSPVRIDGSLTGEVISNSLLIVGEHAIVRAKVDVGSLIVLGEVTGDVNADELVEIRSTGNLRGDISTARIAIQEGGFYQGSISLKKSPTDKE